MTSFKIDFSGVLYIIGLIPGRKTSTLSNCDRDSQVNLRNSVPGTDLEKLSRGLRFSSVEFFFLLGVPRVTLLHNYIYIKER